MSGTFRFNSVFDLHNGLMTVGNLPLFSGDYKGALKQLNSIGPVTDVPCQIYNRHRLLLSASLPYAIALNGVSPGIYEFLLEDSPYSWAETVDLTSLPQPSNTLAAHIVVLRREINPDGFLFISGRVRNCGVMSWSMNRDFSSAPIRVGARIEEESTGFVLHEARAKILRGNIPPGEESPFSILIDLASICDRSRCTIVIDILREGLCWGSLANPPYRTTLFIPEGLRGKTRQTKLSVKSLSPCGDQGVIADIELTNSGSLPLMEPPDDPHPYLVRIDSAIGEEPLVWTGTARLRDLPVGPGEVRNLSTEFRCNLNQAAESLSLQLSVERFQASTVTTNMSEPFNWPIMRLDIQNQIYAERPCYSRKNATLYIFTLGLPRPSRDTNSIRTMEIAKLIAELGIRVSFVVPGAGLGDDQREVIPELSRLGIGLYEWPLLLLSSSREDPAPVFLFSYYSASTLYWNAVRAAYPSAPTIVDSVDIHWLRLSRGMESGLMHRPPVYHLEETFQERQAYQRADEVWVVSKEDKHELDNSGIQVETTIVPLAYDVREPPRTCDGDILFIGNFQSTPNIDAVLSIHRFCTQLREEGMKDFKVQIVGSNFPDDLRFSLIRSWFNIRGHVPDIQDAYRGCSILLAPLRYGAGVKGKILEALSFGLCVITSPVGNEGIDLKHQEEAFLCSNDAEFLSSIRTAITDSENRRSMVQRAQSRILSSFSRDRLRAQILSSRTLRSVFATSHSSWEAHIHE